MTKGMSIPTVYSNTQFRSRLEAKWAKFFDGMNMPWEYEPKTFKFKAPSVWYLPDFYLPSIEWWAEVKPLPFSETERYKCVLLSNETRQGCLLLSGSPTFVQYPNSARPWPLTISSQGIKDNNPT